jgi:tRNA pseudouridine(38-40) synthase
MVWQSFQFWLFWTVLALWIQTMKSFGTEMLKRKVVLLCGYVGSRYNGLQMRPLEKCSLPTIENEMRIALSKAGHVIESNSFDLSKIGWSKSSRTDKGVHAARILFSAKLEIPEVFLKTAPDSNSKFLSFPEVVKNINDYLPSDIRVFSCSRTAGGFDPRNSGTWRAYEYIMPLSILKTSDSDSKSDEELLQNLNKCLNQFEGCHSFHNFHRVRMKILKTKKPPRKSDRQQIPGGVSTEDLLRTGKGDGFMSIAESTVASPLDEADEEELTSETAETRKEQASVTDEDSFEEIEPLSSSSDEAEEEEQDESPSNNPYAYWQRIPRGVHLRSNGVIYKCKARFCEFDFAPNEKFVKVQIVGKSFLLQ